ncbi:MAG: OB-fold nucleic acid binding domain-containing protein, partial [Silvibacterium sp.]
GHPLDKYSEKLRNLPGVVDTATALEMKPAPSNGRRGQAPENEIAIAGVILGLKVAKSKRSGELYAQASLEDTVGKIELICFPKDYERLAANLRIEVPVLVRGQLRAEEDAAPKLAVSSVQALEDVKVRLPQNVRIRIPLERASESTLFELQKIIAAAPGSAKFMLNLEQPGEYCVVLEPAGQAIAADRAFIERAELLLGRGMVQALD